MNIHFIEDETVKLAYFGETARFFEVNDLSKSIIQDLLAGASEASLAEKYNLPESQIIDFKDTLTAYSQLEKPIPEITALKGLKKLVLNISNACNLRCKYCYAQNGHYNSHEGYMRIDTAKQALDAFYKQYGTIKVVQLFGGEPTLNMPLMKFVCEYIAEKNKTQSTPTRIGFVTNGTIVTDELINLINTYHLGVTVSYDGDPIVNDLLRVFPNEKGSSELVVKNIKKLLAETGEPNTLEVTYSDEHIKHGVKIVDMMQYLHKEFGKTVDIHIAPATGDCHCSSRLKDLAPFIESVDEIFAQDNPDDYIYNMIQSIINNLVNKKMEHDYICGASIRTISVSSEGKVFPCFTFTDTNDLYMGNVQDEKLFESESFTSVQNKFLSFSKSQNGHCNDCFAKRLCNGCLGCHFVATHKPFELSKANCDMDRRMAEKLILNIYKLKKAEVH